MANNQATSRRRLLPYLKTAVWATTGWATTGGVTTLERAFGVSPSMLIVQSLVALAVLAGIHTFTGWCRDRFALRRGTPRAWATLATQSERGYTYIAAAPAITHRCGVFRSSEPSDVRAAKREFARLLRKVRGGDVSLALAPDGTRAATLASQKLDVMFVSATRSGCCYEWKSVTLPERQETLQILAVARRGETDAWLALAATYSAHPTKTNMFLLALSDLEIALGAGPNGTRAGFEWLQPYLLKVTGNGPPAYGPANPYAAFLGTRLLFLDANGSLLSVATSSTGAAEQFLQGHEALSHRQVLAVDTVRLPGRDYVALLTQHQDTDEGNIVLFVEWESELERNQWKMEKLQRPACHISVVRDPTGVVRDISLRRPRWPLLAPLHQALGANPADRLPAWLYAWLYDRPAGDVAALRVLCGSGSSFESVYMVIA